MADAQAKRTVLSLQIYTNLERPTYTRTIYSILNLLGDVGGLQGILMTIGYYLSVFIITN